MARFLAFRDRFAGTIQDVCAALAMLAFLFAVALVLIGVAG